MKLIIFCLTMIYWALIYLVPAWAVICLIVVIYFISKTFGVRDLHSDDYYVFMRLFFGLLFLPIWMPIENFIQKRESRKIREYVDGIRNRSVKVESGQNTKKEGC